MGKVTRIHFAGEVRTKRMHVLPGWAACCSGEKADRIKRERQHTYKPQEVTCWSCRRVMLRDERYARLVGVDEMEDRKR